MSRQLPIIFGGDTGGVVTTKTQTAIARIRITPTKTQSAIARVQKNFTKTQTAVARIQTSPIKTQPAVARVSKIGVTRTQSAVARLTKSGITKTQTANARVTLFFQKTQTSIARIQNTAVHATQTATARIQEVRTKTQTAVARIALGGGNKTQTATARIQNTQTKTQPAKGRISKSFTKTQSAVASILLRNPLITSQLATARIQSVADVSVLGEKGFLIENGQVSSPIFSAQINDDFNRPDGSMAPYYTSTPLRLGGPLDVTLSNVLPSRHHLDIARFSNDDITVPFTQNDYNFWHGFDFTGLTAGGSRGLGIFAGTENWDSTVSIGPNSSYRYANTLVLSIGSGGTDSTYGVATYGVSPYGAVVTSSKTTSSMGTDILTNFSVPGRQYFIECVLRSFPAQVAAAHFDLNNSYIDFSNTIDFSAAVDSLKFSQSSNDVSGGGDTYLKFSRDLIGVNCDLTNIRAIRFRLKSIGGTSTFTAQALRLVDDQYVFSVIDTDTKRKQLTRSVPQAGGTESSTPFGAIFFQNVQPKNATYITSFNAGHNPVGNDNIIRQYFRTSADGLTYIEIDLTCRSTQSQITIKQYASGTPTTIYTSASSSNTLTTNTYYYWVNEVNNNQVRSSVYAQSATNSIALGTLVYTTGWQTITLNGNGFVGYSFEPYNYDFTMQSIGPQALSFADFKTTAFNSRTLVESVTLYPVTSPQVDIETGVSYSAWGDASLVTATSGEITVTRDGSQTQGGVVYLPICMGNSGDLTFSGYIWTTAVHGTYRGALIDKYGRVEWIQNIPNMLANVWNNFSIQLPGGIIPESSYFVIQQVGSYSGSFVLRDVGLTHTTIVWTISPDNTNWYPFMNAISGEFTGVRFPTPTNSMYLTGSATSDQGWIAGYQLQPHYVL